MKTTIQPWTTRVSSRFAARVAAAPVLIFLAVTCLTACYKSPSQQQFDSAVEMLADGRTSDAEKLFEKIFKESPDKTLVLESAKQIYEISYFRTRNYPKALRHLETIIANADSFAESIGALKKKALIEHKNLSNYEAAITSYGRLLSNTSLSMAEENEFRLNLGKCLLAINKFELARAELKPLLEAARPNEVRYAAKNLEASSYQTEGAVDKAIAAYQGALEFATNEAEKQDVLMDIALCYEQKEQYGKALEALNKIQLTGPFLDEKKKQLERLAKFQGRRLNR